MTESMYYINGAGIISPQHTFDNPVLISPLQQYEENVLKCVTPDFKTLINPVQLRRLSRFLKIGLASAILCLNDAGENSADGIITATGYGFLDDMAKFLNEVIQQEEQQIAPINFTQSTYNALAGLVALHMKCLGYNSTYVSKGFAFETGVLDAMMQLHENPVQKFLVGAFDEADATQRRIKGQPGWHYKLNPINNLRLFETQSRGVLQGEGSAFFMISSTRSDRTWCELKALKMVGQPDEERLLHEVTQCMSTHQVDISDIGLIVVGASGDFANDEKINRLVNERFGQTPQMKFKHLCGEYCTASSFALWIGASALKHQQVPFPSEVAGDLMFPLKNVLIINQYMDRNYSLFLLQKV